MKRISLSVQEGDFILLCGPSGSGKTTLLNHVKPEIRPAGEMSGEILYRGKRLDDPTDRQIVTEIGIVFQDPEMQLVTETVREELAFTLENAGCPPEEMRKRMSEIVYFFGIGEWLDRPLRELSGGQKQLVNLASVLLMRPRLLLLDEPTSQLDPVSARQFLQLVERINREFSTAVIISEHRLEEIFPAATRIVLMADGEIVAQNDPRSFCRQIWEQKEWRDYLPVLSRIYLQFAQREGRGEDGVVPLTINEGRRWLAGYADGTLSAQGTERSEPTRRDDPPPVMKLVDVSFQYERGSRRLLDQTTFDIPSRGILAVTGGNGAGKSTLLKLLLGLLRPQSGKVLYRGRPVLSIEENERFRAIGYLDQNPLLYFARETVEQSLDERVKKLHLSNPDEQVRELMETLQLQRSRLSLHPFDLSGGERQKAALLLVLLSDPDILLLDEPTKGLDPQSKKFFGSFLRKWGERKSAVLVSHDIEFAAEYATSFTAMFDGQLTPVRPARSFFGENYFYTTSVRRLFHGILPELTTFGDVVNAWRPR